MQQRYSPLPAPSCAINVLPYPIADEVPSGVPMSLPTSQYEKPFRIREFTSTDAEVLLAFETENREWFEAHIEARAASFYSSAGVAEHIEGYLSDLAVGVWHPLVIEDANAKIVGRANLKNIDVALGTAEVGYRIARTAGGQGLATMVLKYLVQQAQTRWGLTQLLAYVREENLGSTTVLERCGFTVAASEKSDTGIDRRFVCTL